MTRSLRERVVALVALFTAGGVAACANASAPPGGPPDNRPPMVIAVTPASGSTGIQPREVEIRFDEVISEVPRGAQDLAGLVFISPRSGAPRVSWNRSRITIRPQRGFQPNRVYTVEVRPGIVDLRSNPLDSAIRIVFSTGGDIPDTRVSGVVFDWVLGRAAPGALVEAIAPDSTTYVTLADSTGRFTLLHAPAGGYVMRAVLDRNNNRELDPLEPWDTASVVMTGDARAELYAFQRDTMPMRMQTIVYVDSIPEVRVTFDKPFAIDMALGPDNFRLLASDSTPVTIVRIETAPQRRVIDSVQRAVREDSIRRAQATDTTAAARARADSVARARAADSIANLRRIAEQRRQEAIRRGERPPPIDTIPPPRMSRPQPYAEVHLILGAPLTPGATYVLSTQQLRSLSGTVKPTPSRNFRVPQRPARDTTQRDSLR